MLPPCLLQQRGTGQRLGAHASACEPTTALGSPRQRLGAHRLVYRLVRLSRRMCSWPIMNMMLPPSAGPPAMCG